MQRSALPPAVLLALSDSVSLLDKTVLRFISSSTDKAELALSMIVK